MSHEGYTLVNMKMDPKKREETPETAITGRPAYPYGLEVRLDKEALEKLDMAGLPKVGSSKLLHARVEVTGCQDSERTGEGGKVERDRSVTLQITDLALAADDTESRKSTADALYGD